ncbi:hypothetical protein PIB30_046520 [Stylosanthes scabra]|uniref:No apical meristem-associated C-terminal domain-containing protein n=1 Tax=Stylosanthes scabra TaxID=79078 RepID=A0ABU6ZFB5_9FABA|nr:hypothetical protein [Stylosanthes scabra]
MFNSSSLPFPTQFSASRPDPAGVGGSSNPSPQIPLHSSSNSEFANTRGLDAIDLNNDEIEEISQENIHYLKWEKDEILIIGTDQKGETFWNRIHNYNKEYDPTMKRVVGATEKRWHKINKAVAQFAGCYDQATRNIRSGSSSDDIKELAYKIYSSNYETPLAEDAGIDSLVHPQGSKKSKRRRKGKAQMSEDLNEKKSSIVKKLALIENFMNFRENEMSDLEKEREMQKEHREKLMAMKEKELQMKEQELQMKEREMDMQIFNVDTSVMSERKRALHEIACEKIIAKWFS